MKKILQRMIAKYHVLLTLLLIFNFMQSCDDKTPSPVDANEIITSGYDQNPDGQLNTEWPLSGENWFNPSASKDDPSDAFGPRLSGSTYDFHQGMDFLANSGTKVYAVASGIVKRRETGAVGGGLERFGNFIVIEHSENSGDLGDYQTAYLHLKSFKGGISVGDHVNKGQLIGYVGNTGVDINTDHLHLCLYERTDGLIVNDYVRNPLKILNYDASQSGDAYYNVTVNRITSDTKISVTITVPDHALDLNEIFIDPSGASNARKINYETKEGLNPSDIDDDNYNDVQFIAEPSGNFLESSSEYKVRFRYTGSWGSTASCRVRLKDTHGNTVYDQVTTF